MSFRTRRSNRFRFAAATLGVLVLTAVGPAVAGTLAAAPAARYGGGFGLAVDVGDGSPAFVRDDTPISERSYEVRFYLRVRSLNMAEGDEFDLFRAADSSDLEQLALSLRRTGGQTWLRWRLRTDAGMTETPPGAELALLPGWQAVELAWLGAESGQSNGELRLWVDGGGAAFPDYALGGVLNANSRLDHVEWGAVAGLDAGTGGTFALDEFVSRRSGYIGLLSTFVDLDAASAAWPAAQAIFNFEITAGCAAGAFCPDDPVTREQMAVLALRAAEGPDFVPPPCGSAPFADVSVGSEFCSWIQALAAGGMAPPCAGGYCPQSAVTRAQAVEFLLRALEGGGYAPATCASPPFADVDTASPSCRWIQEAASAARDISEGCGNGNYCPADPVTRSQLALLLVRTFDLALPAP